MSTFLDRARDLRVEGVVHSCEEHFDNVFEAIVRLREVFYKSGLDLDNVESLFGAFEMARTIKKLSHYSSEEISQLVESMTVLIAQTLLHSVRYPYTSSQVDSPKPYNRFVHVLKNAISLPASSDAQRWYSILTFNYDFAIDYAFACASLQPDYCLTGPDGREHAIKLLKLHGSLNWVKCPGCGQIGAVQFSSLSRASALSQALTHGDGKTVTLPFVPGMGTDTCKNCSKELLGHPVLVPPTWNKAQGHAELATVWTQAAIELGQAENIFCIGYSLPESDLFFRYLFALGTVGDAHLRRFWVFDPDPTGRVEERYRRLIGRGIEHRFRFFKGESGMFSNALAASSELRQALEE